LKTGLITSPRFLDHDPGPGHPESPQRLRAVLEHLEQSGLLNAVARLEPQIKTPEMAGLVHSTDYIQRVEAACAAGARLIDTPDNPICPATYDVAVLAVNAVTRGVDSIMAGKVKNVLVLLRPPGHHAEESQAMGFCFFNNVAVAAAYARRSYDLDRVAIIDFDVHHGNGTQHIFESDSSVLYASLHRYPFYPGTGSEQETGRGEGLGTTVNYPLPAGTGDDIYLDVVRNSLADKVLRFRPDLLILSAGFDAHEWDPLGGMRVTTDGFRSLTRLFRDLAEECCAGRLLSVLEGGYNLKGLSESVQVHLEEFMDRET
jgi:acetoin utilization deacetylase AcuC-like enzyme